MCFANGLAVMRCKGAVADNSWRGTLSFLDIKCLTSLLDMSAVVGDLSWKGEHESEETYVVPETFELLEDDLRQKTSTKTSLIWWKTSSSLSAERARSIL